jgi:hypothetical protein
LNAFRAGDVNGLVPCKPARGASAKCRDQFVRVFGEKAFRRPLDRREIRRYDDLFAEQANRTGKFSRGARRRRGDAAVAEVSLSRDGRRIRRPA